MTVIKVAPERSLTDQQVEFVRSISRDNVSPTEAARRAGYSQPHTAAWRLMKSPQVAAAVRQAHFQEVDSNLTGVALRTLKVVMEDSSSPASARVAAARAIVDMSGMTGRKLSEDESGPAQEVSFKDFLASLPKKELEILSSALSKARDAAVARRLDHHNRGVA